MAYDHDRQLVAYSFSQRRRRRRSSSTGSNDWPQQLLVVVAVDVAISFTTLWASGLVSLLVRNVLRWGERPEGVALGAVLNAGRMVVFAWVGRDVTGGNVSPVSVLRDSFSGDGPTGILFAVLGRIPAQVIGSLIGVRSIKAAFPAIRSGPQLSVSIQHGALIEGFLTFMFVMISLMLKKKDPEGFLVKTWISSLSKMMLRILGSDLTGGIMNPASAFSWAYARGEHKTMEHLMVYWLAPVQATMLGVLAFRFFTEPNKAKSE